MLKYYASALMAGFLLDLLIGDPRWMYHPVIFIGKTISVLEKKLLRRRQELNAQATVDYEAVD